MRPTVVALVAIPCLVFTVGIGIRPGWADDSRSSSGAHGVAVRAGTVVGQTRFAGAPYNAIGATMAIGTGFGRVSGELEYDALMLDSDGAPVPIFGVGRRLAANVRLDVVRIGRRWVGARSRILLWVELGVGRQWTAWEDPDVAGAQPDETTAVTRRMETLTARPSRGDTSAGLGWLLDHRPSRSAGVPSGIGWLLGWRVTRATGFDDTATDALAVCRSPGCRPPPPRRTADLGLVLHSSLVVTW